jgi:hypothetical protein
VDECEPLAMGTLSQDEIVVSSEFEAATAQQCLRCHSEVRRCRLTLSNPC